MERFPMIGDPASTTKTRLSFQQIFLLLSYIHLESSLPASIGDIRQLQDILRRGEDEWIPRVGQETYLDMRQKMWAETNWQTRRAWDATRRHFLQQDLIDDTMSSRELREYLSRLLHCIEQISAQSFNTIGTRRPQSNRKPCMLLSEKANFVMICFSVGVIATQGEGAPLKSLLVDPEHAMIDELSSELCVSPLFKDGVSPAQLWDSCASLDALFCSERPSALDYGFFAEAPDSDLKATVITSKQETWTCQYSRTETKETVYQGPAPNQRHKRAWDPYFGDAEAGISTKRQKVSSPNKARKQLTY